VGFEATISDFEEKGLSELLADVEQSDLMKFGLIPEFVGRIPVIATLEELDVDALKKVLVAPRNSLVKQYQKLFELDGIKLTFTEDAIAAIAQKAVELKTGARGLRSIIEDLLLDTMFELPLDGEVNEIVVSDAAVLSQAPLLKFYSEKKMSNSMRSRKAW